MTEAMDGMRRSLVGAGLALAVLPAVAAAQSPGRPDAGPRRMLSAASFGVVGDGAADDTAALQAALEAAFRPGGAGFLAIPPGTYRITRTLRVATVDGPRGNVVHHSGISAHGARLKSEIADGGNVFEFISSATVRFLLIEGLDIAGSGREGHGIHLECEEWGKYLYNFCLRDVVVQNCGGDGCRMLGNVFEAQMVNCYFRGNKGNGATFGHGFRKGILSSIHAFGCVFGENGRHGVAMVNKCSDVAFHGCYFLLNGKFGLVAENGCTLLSNCGFENNHQSAAGFESGDAGIALQNFGTLIGCTAYSIFNQTHLIRAYAVGQLVLVGCSGSGSERALGAGLARIGGQKTAGVTVIGSAGAVVYVNGLEGIEIAGSAGGARFGSNWQGGNLVQLGEYRLWVDGRGNLRLKKGKPTADDDGATVRP